MSELVSERVSNPVRVRALRLPDERTLGLIGLSAIVVLAAALRFANLGALGDVNHYYTAAINAMLQSWHNFFFVAAEPGGSVSVDKPPVGLWVETISAFFFGVNTLGVLLPEIISGLLSVVVVYHLVRRTFGTAAGLIAALALAVTPVVVATDRNNTIDSMLILTVLLAAWAFIKATETSKFRFLLLGAALVGIGFNIKMLQAYLPLPAFLALYFFGSKDRLLPKLGKLAVAGLVLVVISLSWATVVDLVPANQRPYVGSSGDNSEWSLMIGYNGTERLLGMGGRGGLLSSLLSGNSGRGFQPGGFAPGPRGQGGFNGAPGGFFGGAPGGFFGGGGGLETGRAGLMRLFTAPLSKEASWLLPLALIGGLLLAFRSRLSWPISAKHQALILWGGWLLLAGGFFSVAGFFHQYYLATFAPPVAILAGIGAMELWHIREKRQWLGLGLLLIAAFITLMLQFNTALAFVRFVWWLPVVIALFLIGALLLTPFSRELNRAVELGFACIVAALLVTPLVWSGLTMLYPAANQSLPAAYDGTSSGPANRGNVQVNESLLSYLEANTQGVKYLVGVPSSMQGSDYVIATGKPVLYLGGFMGEDQVLTSAQLQNLIENGELRYFYWDTSSGDGFGGGRGGPNNAISSYIQSSCKLVPGYETSTQNSGAPDGTGRTTGTGGFRGSLQISLYDCG